MLALPGGLFLDDLYAFIKCRQPGKWAVGVVVSAVLGSSSVLLARQMPQPQVTWDRVVWGYVRMGKQDMAKTVATRIAAEQPENSAIQEALGYMAGTEGDYPGAVEHYRRAAELRPDSHVAHYNLAKMLVKTGARDEAANEAAIAVRIAPLPDYKALVDQLTRTK
jgi:predicted Zn-dependent protease